MTVLSYSLTLTIGLGLGVVAMKFHYGWQLAMWKKAHAELEFAYAQLFAKQTRARRGTQIHTITETERVAVSDPEIRTRTLYW